MQRNYSQQLHSIWDAGFWMPVGAGFFAILLLFAPFGFIISILLFGVIFISDGIEIDFENTKFRIYNVYFIRYGKWKKLPKITKIRVVGGTEARKAHGRSTSYVVVKEKFIYVKIYFKSKFGEKAIEVYRGSDMDKAKQIANYLQDILFTKN